VAGGIGVGGSGSQKCSGIMPALQPKATSAMRKMAVRTRARRRPDRAAGKRRSPVVERHKGEHRQ